MEFLYHEYEQMLDLLIEREYIIRSYTSHSGNEKCVILRHDVDFSLKKALTFARLEASKKIKSTYFILLSTDFYNIYSKESHDLLKEIISLGHDIGLHFDEKRYIISDFESLELCIKKEINVLEGLLGNKIQVVSMHRPSAWILENDIKFDGLINTYSNYYFKEFEYLSDSRMFWREDVLDLIEKESFKKLHIVIHPFWYSDKTETIKEKLLDFINDSRVERYYSIKNNFRNIEDVLNEEELF